MTVQSKKHFCPSLNWDCGAGMIIARKKWYSEATLATPLRYISAESGNVAIVVALSASFIFACVGAAIDFGRIISARSSLQIGVDAAALAARNSNYKSAGDLTSFAHEYFEKNQLSDAKLSTLEAKYSTTDELAVHATASVTLAFGALLGMQTTQVKADASVRKSSDPIDVDLILDMSASMDLASTAEGQEKLIAITAVDSADGGCAFACHWPADDRTGKPFPYANYYDAAVKNGIELRSDALANAAQLLVDALYPDGPNLDISTTAWAFSDWHSKIQPAADGPFSVRDAMNSFSATWGTQPANFMNSLVTEINTNNIGNRPQFIVLATDGWTDRYGSGGGPWPSTYCDMLKANGATLAVINVKYPYLPDQPYMSDILNGYESLQEAMKSCPTPGWYFEADESDQIKAAFGALAEKIRDGNKRLRLIR